MSMLDVCCEHVLQRYSDKPRADKTCDVKTYMHRYLMRCDVLFTSIYRSCTAL